MRGRSKKRKTPFGLQYVPNPNQPDIFLTLDEIRDALPKGKWKHTLVFDLVDTASECALPLSAFMEWDPLDRAMRIARNRIKSVTSAYEHLLQEEEAKKNRPKGKKKR